MEAWRQEQEALEKRSKAQAWHTAALVGQMFFGKAPSFAEFVGVEVKDRQTVSEMKAVLKGLRGGKAA